MPVNKYISQEGNGSGDSVADPMSFEQAIGYVNSLPMPLADDYFMNVITDISLDAQPEALVVGGNENGRITWQGRDADGLIDTLRFMDSAEGVQVDWAFGSTARMDFHAWRYLAGKYLPPSESTDGGALCYFPNGVKWSYWFRCKARSAAETDAWRLLQVGTALNAMAKGTVVQCMGHSLGASMLSFGIHGDVDVIECVSRNAGGSSTDGSFTYGGQYIRCISDSTPAGDGFYRPRGGVALTSYNATGNGINYAEAMMGFFVDCVVSDAGGAAGVLLQGDDSLGVLATLIRHADHNSALRTSQPDGGVLYDVSAKTVTEPPFIDAGAINFEPNNVPGGGMLLRNTAGVSLPGGLTESYHDIGAAESQCEELPDDVTVHSGTVIGRSLN